MIDELPLPKPKFDADIKEAIAMAVEAQQSRRKRRIELYRQHQAYIEARLDLADAYWDETHNNIESEFDDWIRVLRQEASSEAGKLND